MGKKHAKKAARKQQSSEDDFEVDDMQSVQNEDVEDQDNEDDDQEFEDLDAELQEEDNTEFIAHGEELDLPEDTDDEESDASDSEDDDGARQLEEYCKELGIEAEFTKPTPAKKSKKEAQVDKAPVQSKNALLIDKVIEKARSDPKNHKNLSMVVRIVKQVFNTEKEQDDETDGKKKKKGAKKGEVKQQNSGQIIANALNTAEYRKLFDFFLTEMPALVLQFQDIDLKPFEKFNKKLTQYREGGEAVSDRERPYFNMKKVYSKMSTKQGQLMKTYAANYLKLLNQSGSDRTGPFSTFFVSGEAIVQCCLPFKLYAKKLLNVLATISMQYNRVDQTSQILAFNSLYKLVGYLVCTTKPKSKDDEEDDDQPKTSAIFEMAVKKMYVEFTKESKSGGGGHQVQDTLRIAQNCLVELLALDLQQSYKFGFLYVRQLCLHLRNIRNNMSQDAVKGIYSWQFFNCIKIWVLATCQYKDSELILLVHPIVQLLIGTIKLNGNLKYFPYHIKVYELLSQINERTSELIPCSQYLLQIFEGHTVYFNAKSKTLTDKIIPETLISLKINKKHIDTFEMKERIVKEITRALEVYFAAQSHSIAFPEMIVPVLEMLRKFKKVLTNSALRKIVGDFIDKLKENSEYMQQKRVGVKVTLGKRGAKEMLKSLERKMKSDPKDKSPLDLHLQKVRKMQKPQNDKIL